LPVERQWPAARTLQSLLSANHMVRDSYEENIVMLYWAAVFFIIALVAALFGFGGLAAGAVGIAKILFFVFLILAVVSLIFGRRAPV
jgi:uncharacterized membrane protein YtjA (UPF0391 family)